MDDVFRKGRNLSFPSVGGFDIEVRGTYIKIPKIQPEDYHDHSKTEGGTPWVSERAQLNQWTFLRLMGLSRITARARTALAGRRVPYWYANLGHAARIELNIRVDIWITELEKKYNHTAGKRPATRVTLQLLSQSLSQFLRYMISTSSSLRY